MISHKPLPITRIKLIKIINDPDKILKKSKNKHKKIDMNNREMKVKNINARTIEKIMFKSKRNILSKKRENPIFKTKIKTTDIKTIKEVKQWETKSIIRK